jgi:hypothetical protein
MLRFYEAEKIGISTLRNQTRCAEKCYTTLEKITQMEQILYLRMSRNSLHFMENEGVHKSPPLTLF